MTYYFFFFSREVPLELWKESSREEFQPSTSGQIIKVIQLNHQGAIFGKGKESDPTDTSANASANASANTLANMLADTPPTHY